MAEPLLRVAGLTIGFPTQSGKVALAANDVSFEVEPGRSLGIVGESGSGKSVTLRGLMGLVQYPGEVLQGTVRLDGRSLLELSEREWQKVRGRDLAMIFQDPLSTLNPLFTVGDQVREVLRKKRGLRRAAARSEAVTLLEQVGIRDAERRVHDYPHQLSGGMRQRVVIAMAIAARARLLLADEPTTALDVTVQDQILTLLQAVGRDFDMTTILVSHDLGVVGQVCDDVVVMYAGRVVERGPIDEVLEKPRHPYTEGLAQAVAELSTARSGGSRRLKTMPGQQPLLSALPPGCSFAPRCEYRVPACETFDMHLDEPSTHPTACLVRQKG